VIVDGTPGVLSEEQLEAVHERAMTILEDIGVEIRQDAACLRLATEGQKVEDSRVRFDRHFVEAMVARAPERFTLRARNPDRSVPLGGGSLVHTPSGGSPLCSDLERGRREGTLADHVELVELAHAARSRHLGMDYAVLRWSDKPYICCGGLAQQVAEALAGGQIARRYGVRYRGGGGLCSGTRVDAQSATESRNMLWATHLSGCDLVLHAASWLEAGLTTSYEKLAREVEVLSRSDAVREGIVTDEEHFAIDTTCEEGPGGMSLASPHTLEHFRDWVWMSPLFRSDAHANWVERGSPDAEAA